MSVIGKRLKEARLQAGLSQEQLGLQAGLEAESASARMNRYERGTRVPAFELLERIALVLGVPASFFYAVQDDEAKLLLAFHKQTAKRKREVLALLDAQ